MTRAALVLAGLCIACAIGARAQDAEPPPEAGAGDWSAETADSLPRGWLETTFTSRGRAGGAPRSGERMRFRNGESAGTFRSGAEPLAGTRLLAPLARGTLRAGRLAPRWGRGLLLGAAAQPWSARADDRGEDAPLRGHAGDGAQWRSGGGSLEAVTGRFAKRTLVGARASRGPAALAALAGAGEAQGALAVDAGAFSGEWAADARGRWRAEGLARARAGTAALSLRARGGLAGFRSLAEPARRGPARVLAAGASGERRSGASWRGAAAMWAFAPGASGAAATLEVDHRLGDHAAVAFGLEEQQGARRESAPGSAPAASNGLRQGWWCEWRGRAGGRALALRHELRGTRAFARHAVRRAILVSGESALPWGASLAIRHAAWSAHAGESSWIAETDGDVWTLRSAPGAGQRAQVTLAAPALGGRVRAGAEWKEVPTGRPAPAWTLEWTRRTRQ